MRRGDRDPQPTLILTADWHLRENRPICRTDDFIATQWRKVKFVANLADRYKCDVYLTGDLFHHWKASPYLLTQAYALLPKSLLMVYGQHDLPQHNLELAEKSAAFNLIHSQRIWLLSRGHFGTVPEPVDLFGRHIVFWHHMSWMGKPPWPGAPPDGNADAILDQFPDADLIVTGDNHKPFVREREGQLLVNPGCLTRQKADEADHKPRVYLWYHETNTVQPVFVPIEDNVVSREHILEHEKRDARIAAFISKLSDEWDVTVDFETNLERCFEENVIPDVIRQIILKALEKEV